MNMEKEAFEEGEIESRLWAYLDGLSEETTTIEDLLQEDKAWKEKYGELLELHTLMREAEPEQPSLRFTKNVMEEIARQQITPAVKVYINKNIIRGIAAFFITVIAGFLVYGFSQLQWSDGSGRMAGGIDLSTVDFSKMFNNDWLNGFLMLNVVLGLFLLDRFLNLKRRQRAEA